MANQVTTTITKSIAQAGLSFLNSDIVLTGNVAPYIETNVAVGTPETINVSIDTTVNMVYLLSDQLDCTVAFYAGAGGTGTLLSTQTIQAGTAFEWDSSMPASGSPTYHSGALTACLSMVITATAFIDGVAASTPTNTDVHARTSIGA